MSRRAVAGVMATLLIGLIRLYQLTLSKVLVALFGPVCRFEPSCSRYAAACLRDHGVVRGSLLSVKRLCRCHPFHPGGWDPPPPPRHTLAAAGAAVGAQAPRSPAIPPPAPSGEPRPGRGED